MADTGEVMLVASGRNRRSVSEMSVDAQILVRRLQRCKEEEFVSYEELSEMIKRNVQTSQARHLLTTAMRVLTREQGFVFSCVHGKGIKRLSNGVIAPTVGSSLTGRIRNATSRAGQKLKAVDYSALNQQEQVQYNTTLSIVGSIALLTSTRAQAEVETQTRLHREPLPTAQVLTLLAR